MSAVDDAIERAEKPEYGLDPRPLIVEDRRILAAEVKRLRRFIPPNGWAQFGTHANCRDAWLEFSEEVGEDGLPLWERVVVRQDLDPDEMVSDPRWTQ